MENGKVIVLRGVEGLSNRQGGGGRGGTPGYNESPVRSGVFEARFSTNPPPPKEKKKTC